MFKSKYGMYSPEGDTAVFVLLGVAKRFNMNWPEVLKLIDAVAKTRPAVAEIRDTAVREVIYERLGFETDFYPSYRDWETDRKSTRLNSSHRL